MSKHERLSATDAQAKLVQATLESLMEEGTEGCSIRKICERANMSVGLVNYHFGTINDLLAATYRELALSKMNIAVEQAQSADGARQQMSEFIKATFSESVMQVKVLRAWMVFWSLVDRSSIIKAAHDETNQAFRAYLETLFFVMNAHRPVKPTPRLAAIGLTAVIDGLWLEWCLSNETFSPEEAITLCEQWLDSSLAKT